jgi:hypothetical protein
MSGLSTANHTHSQEICLQSSCRLVSLGVFLLWFSIILSSQAASSEVPEANPARPTVSTSATLTPAGYLQFENGGLFAAIIVRLPAIISPLSINVVAPTLHP